LADGLLEPEKYGEVRATGSVPVFSDWVGIERGLASILEVS